MEPDFSGWVTKYGIKCTDGRTILAPAMQHMDGAKVPLVYAHSHDEVENILGHVILHAKSEGVRGDAFFNDTTKAQAVKIMVQHGDLDSLSIFANKLIERAKQVSHGIIREVSLVLAGANDGAKIDNVSFAHSDGSFEEVDDAAIMSFYEPLELNHADTADSGMTIQDVYDSLDETQKNVVNYMIGQALQAKEAAHSALGDDDADDSADDDAAGDEGDLTHQKGNSEVSRNVFEQNDKKPAGDKATLSHADREGIFADAMRGGSLKNAVKDYALKHGIDNIDILFPDAKAVSDKPEFISRRMAWVAGVLAGVTHSPFSRIKTLSADITLDDARAKGYIKGHMKKEEFFSVTKRTTAPTTVYKKQKLDRDDIIDITDFDVVSWMKGEMRIMTDEEIARAILIGDGRAVDDEDKIKDPIGATDGIGIRSILNDHELYVTQATVNLTATPDYNQLVERVMFEFENYKGSGSPTFYTTQATLTRMLLTKDANLRRLYNSKAELISVMGVNDIIPVEVMETIPGLLGIMVNLTDYRVGTDKGGEVNMFDDFDLDYNQYKYLMETRLSGALTKMKSAIVFKSTAAANVLVDPTDPTFVRTTGVVTIPTLTGVVYKNADTSSTLSAGAQTALAAGATLNVVASPAAGYYFADNTHDEWEFTRPAA